MNKSFSFSAKLFITIVCYGPIVGSLLPKTKFGSGLPDLDLVRICTILLLIKFFFDVLKQGAVRINKWIVVVLVYSCNVFASVSWTDAYTYDARQFSSFFDMLFVPLFIAVVGINIFQNYENRRQYARHITIAACILSIMSAYEAFYDLSTFTGVTRAASTLGNPNLLAIILVLWVPLILVSEREKWLSKKTSIVIQALILIGIIGTVSRKGLTTWFITYLLFYYFNNEKNKVILMCILGGGGFLLLLAYSSTVATRFSQEDVQYNLDAKWNMMMAGLTLFLEKPIIGYGYNGYYENFSRFFKYSWEKNYDAHNEYVTALASYGIIGFIWFVSLFLTPFFDLLKRVKFNKPNTQPKTISVDRQFHIMGISLIPPIMMSTFYAGALFKQPVAVISFFAQVAFALAITKQNKE
jgi:O-antigen ligase